jgi:hypothetical protein
MHKRVEPLKTKTGESFAPMCKMIKQRGKPEMFYRNKGTESAKRQFRGVFMQHNIRSLRH